MYKNYHICNMKVIYLQSFLYVIAHHKKLLSINDVQTSGRNYMEGKSIRKKDMRFIFQTQHFRSCRIAKSTPISWGLFCDGARKNNLLSTRQ